MLLPLPMKFGKVGHWQCGGANPRRTAE